MPISTRSAPPGTLVLIAAALAPVARADVLQVNPIADNSIFSNNNANSDGVGPTMYAGQTSFNGVRRALVRFTVSGIPSGSTINSVSLSMNASRLRGGTTLELHRLTTPFGEGASNAGSPGGNGAPAVNPDATWSHSTFPSTTWGTPGGDFNAPVSGSAALGGTGAFVMLGAGMLTDVQSWVANPAQNFGWLIKAASEGAATNAAELGSRENANLNNRPLLSVVYTVPAPGTFSVLA